MTFIKSILFSVLYYMFFLLMLIGINFLNLGNNVALYWIPGLISAFIISILFFASLKGEENRPRSALLLGLVLVIITAIADYVLLVENVFKLNSLLSSLPEQVSNVFKGIDNTHFYKNNLTALVVRYILIFISPFIFSLFIPKPDIDIQLPSTKKK